MTYHRTGWDVARDQQLREDAPLRQPCFCPHCGTKQFYSAHRELIGEESMAGYGRHSHTCSCGCNFSINTRPEAKV